ncbi:MAG: hypothetical protein ACOX8S_11540 [Christensenellales bacterium]
MESEKDLIIRAMEMLRDVTPLKSDCGDICGAACCREPEDDSITGMALFPGEEQLYCAKTDWYKLYYDYKGKNPVLVCKGECPREQRPLACRIFPLTPYSKDGNLSVRIDARAAAMCPLYEHGKKGLSAQFVKAVEEAAVVLWQSDKLRMFIEDTSRQIDAQSGIYELLSRMSGKTEEKR